MLFSYIIDWCVWHVWCNSGPCLMSPSIKNHLILFILPCATRKYIFIFHWISLWLACQWLINVNLTLWNSIFRRLNFSSSQYQCIFTVKIKFFRSMRIAGITWHSIWDLHTAASIIYTSILRKWKRKCLNYQNSRSYFHQDFSARFY